MNINNKYKKYIGVLCVCCLFICGIGVDNINGQDYKDVLFEKKENNNFYKVVYSSKLFGVGKDIKIHIYKNYVGAEEPVAVEIDMDIIEGIRTATIAVDDSVVSMLAYFTDGKTIDNNNGLGYWTPVNREGKLKAGALASIAYMYCGAWNADNFHVRKENRLAKELYEREFSNNHYLLRIYYRWFLSTFDLSDDLQKEEFELQLAKFAASTDLTEWELLAISNYYGRIGNQTLEERYSNYLFEKYKDGCWAAQIKTMPLQKIFSTTTDLSEKYKAYEQFKEQSHIGNDECIRRYMELRKGITMLSKLTPYYVQKGELNNWLKEVNGLSDEFKYPTLLLGARSLNNVGNPTVAEMVATPAIKWIKDHLGSSERTKAERLFYTDQQIRKIREGKYVEFLDIYAASLRMQKKYKASISLYEEAVMYSGGSNEMVNQHLIETLIESGDSTQGKDYINRLSGLVNGGQIIQRQYAELNQKNTDSLKDRLSIVDTKTKKIVEKIDPHPMPELKITDTGGYSVDFKKYQNKILVVDFWASWCVPCIASLEAMRELVRKYEKCSDVAFLIINTMERKDRSVADAMIKNELADMENFLDFRNASVSILGISSLPTAVIVDKNRNIVLIDKGVEESISKQVVKLSTVIDSLKRD